MVVDSVVFVEVEEGELRMDIVVLAVGFSDVEWKREWEWICTYSFVYLLPLFVGYLWHFGFFALPLLLLLASLAILSFSITTRRFSACWMR